MAESSAPPALPNPNYPADSPSPPPPPPPQARFLKRPSVRVTSEFDSDSSVFFHKVSCKVLDSVAKLKVSFSNDHKGEVSPPQVSFISQYLSICYNFEDESTILNSSVDVGPRLQFHASHDLKAQQGEASMVAKFPHPGYALHLSSTFPSAGLPKATLKFPLGEVSLVEKEEQEEQINKAYSMSGIVKGQLFNGLCTAYFAEHDIKLQYSFKDEEMSFIPSISLPSNALSFAFKRRFGPSDKLSYWYNFDSDYWSAVYKHTYGKDLKLKAGYDSEVRLGWASLWVGDEAGKAKTAPLKMKIQFMLQVPQDDIRSSALMFRVKKRWDI